MNGRGPSLVLFLSVFTSQAAVLVLSPILVEVAHDFDVSTATAGQLRIAAAPVAALVAVALLRSTRRVALRSLLAAGAALVAAGSVASAAAPSFAVLALAQVPMWAGVALLVSAGIGAAGSWSAPEERTRVVARALAGAPAAWVVGMPMIGVVAGTSWRLAFLALPLPAAVVTVLALPFAPGERRGAARGASFLTLLRLPGAAGWAAGELLAMSAWAGTLVFSGALFVETYGATPRVTGVVLATVAVAYLAGNALGSRIVGACRLRRALAHADLAAAAAVAATWIVTPSILFTAVVFAAAAAVVAARTVTGTAYGFVLAGERRLEVGVARAVATHVGYLIGSAVGGAAFAIGGRPAGGAVFAGLFLGAALPHVGAITTRCSVRAASIVAG